MPTLQETLENPKFRSASRSVQIAFLQKHFPTFEAAKPEVVSQFLDKHVERTNGEVVEEADRPGFLEQSTQLMREGLTSAAETLQSPVPGAAGMAALQALGGLAETPVRLGANLAATALGPLARFSAQAQGRSVPPGSLVEDVSRIGNLVENRPALTNPLLDFLAGFLPVEQAAPIAGRLLAKGASSVKRADLVREVAKVDRSTAQAIRKALPPGPEISLESAVMRHGPILGEAGGLPPQRNVDVVGVARERLTPGAEILPQPGQPVQPFGELPAIPSQGAGARLAREQELFGSVVPRRTFGLEPEPFPTAPGRLLAPATPEQAAVELAQEGARKNSLEITGFRKSV